MATKRVYSIGRSRYWFYQKRLKMIKILHRNWLPKWDLFEKRKKVLKVSKLRVCHFSFDLNAQNLWLLPWSDKKQSRRNFLQLFWVLKIVFCYESLSYDRYCCACWRALWSTLHYCFYVWKSVCVCVCVCVCERERDEDRERESVCVCVCVRKIDR